MIINTVFMAPVSYSNDPALPIEHLSVTDATHIIARLKPKIAILTHFGMNVWRAGTLEIAKEMSQETGVRVIAARDGMRFDFSELYKKQPEV